ncbi:MAG: cell division ATP-binding protein FtsE [Minwuiales bacterium]|nr:cell division ATP-binding protein FtsE [Minwuiales bacterium]
MAENSTVIAFRNVGLRYGMGPEVLCDINFSLPAGSFHFLTGPSGAGKSSLLKLMYLAHRPTRGLVTLFDEDIAKVVRDRLPLLRRRIGVVFQDFRLLDHLTALENVALPLRLAGGVSDADIQNYVAELLTWVGLGDQMHAKPPVLSGGEQQRVAIARAVITRPKLLLADEPTGNVDNVMGRRLLHLFAQLNKLGTTVVIATHDEDMVARFGHPRLQLDNGHIVVPSNASVGGAGAA